MVVETSSSEMKPCPLCGTMLPYDRWLKVSGMYEEQQKHRKQLEDELNKAKLQSQKLKEEYRKVREKERELKNQFLVKERTLKSELEQKFRLQQEKLESKFKREKQKALNQVRKEGIKIGSGKERARAEKLKGIIQQLKQNHDGAMQKLKEKFQKQEEITKKKLEREKQQALKQIHREGIKIGIEKQKAKTEKVIKMTEKLREERDKAIERTKQLEEMIKKGTTPQIEGLDFERELASQLRQKFPEDEIKQTGKKGDIIQTVQVENKQVGKIIYECKKTQEFQNKFIEQIQRDKAKVVADYGVIVTWATKENRQGFWVEGDIIIVHPYGVLDVSTFLRETVVQMYTLKLSKSEFETKGKAILEFMQSQEFRSRIQDSIVKSQQAYKMLKKEVTTHINTWKKRVKIYESIYRNASIIQNTVRYVLLHGKVPERLPEAKEFPALPLVTQTEGENAT